MSDVLYYTGVLPVDGMFYRGLILRKVGRNKIT